MTINFHVKKKYIVNGKEYNSVEEMPSNIRQAYEKAMASLSDPAHPTNSVTAKTNITFNGQEYESIDAMPHDVRQLFESVMKAVEAGEASPEAIKGAPRSVNAPKPIEPEPVFLFSQRWLIVGVILLILLIGFYYFYKKVCHC